MFDVDGALVGDGNLTPNPLIELIAAGKAKDYPRARAVHDRLLAVTRTVYHRGSHMEGSGGAQARTCRAGDPRAATVRSPLLPLEPGAEIEIADALRPAGLAGQPQSGRGPREQRASAPPAERLCAPPITKQGGTS